MLGQSSSTSGPSSTSSSVWSASPSLYEIKRTFITSPCSSVPRPLSHLNGLLGRLRGSSLYLFPAEKPVCFSPVDVFLSAVKRTADDNEKAVWASGELQGDYSYTPQEIVTGSRNPAAGLCLRSVHAPHWLILFSNQRDHRCPQYSLCCLQITHDTTWEHMWPQVPADSCRFLKLLWSDFQ